MFFSGQDWEAVGNAPLSLEEIYPWLDSRVVLDDRTSNKTPYSKAAVLSGFFRALEHIQSVQMICEELRSEVSLAEVDQYSFIGQCLRPQRWRMDFKNGDCRTKMLGLTEYASGLILRELRSAIFEVPVGIGSSRLLDIVTSLMEYWIHFGFKTIESEAQ